INANRRYRNDGMGLHHSPRKSRKSAILLLRSVLQRRRRIGSSTKPRLLAYAAVPTRTVLSDLPPENWRLILTFDGRMAHLCSAPAPLEWRASAAVTQEHFIQRNQCVEYGGEGGIRTHGTVARTPHFECGAFD